MLNKEYITFLSDIKTKIKQAQIKAAVKANEELLSLYWDIAKEITNKQKNSNWGDGIIEQISKDLKQEFPTLKGFSRTNLLYMKKWYLFWSNENVPQVVGEIFKIPWGHNREIITKCKSIDEALFYVKKTIENGYSRTVLVHQIESDLYNRSKKALDNFDKKLPSPQSDLAKEITKDPYCFDFLSLNEKYNEKELENALMDNLTNFLLELGSGFAFVGRQYRIEIAGDEFFIDLLFYHIKLKCYTVIELKTTNFKPEYAGQLNFYITAVDKEIKEQNDNPTIGILICKSKNNTVVEYALSSIENPIGISEYKLSKQLPDELKNTLPSIEEIESELEKIEAENESNKF